MMTDTEIRNARLRGIPGSILFVLINALFLFLSAGTISWPAACRSAVMPEGKRAGPYSRSRDPGSASLTTPGTTYLFPAP